MTEACAPGVFQIGGGGQAIRDLGTLNLIS